MSKRKSSIQVNVSDAQHKFVIESGVVQKLSQAGVLRELINREMKRLGLDPDDAHGSIKRRD